MGAVVFFSQLDKLEKSLGRLMQVNDAWQDIQAYKLVEYTTPRPRHQSPGALAEVKIMDKDRIIGSAKQIKGELKQAVGKAVGDAKLEQEGQAEKVEGKVQNTVGGLKDTLKGK